MSIDQVKESNFNKQEFFSFIKNMIIIAFPIILQQVFINLASLLDTLMVGQLDDASISGVYIGTQIVFVITLVVYGATEGGSVYLCQFFGKNDTKNMVKSFTFKIYLSLVLSILSTIIILSFADPIARLFSKDENVIKIAVTYLRLLSISFVPYGLTMAFSTSAREIHHALPTMIITLIGTIINCIFNYIFIFGKLGIAPLNTTGAALGTIIQRIVECILIIIYCNIKKYPFLKTFKEDFRISSEFLKKLIIKSIPLVLNEVFWSLSQTVLVYFFTQCDSISTTSLPIASTINSLLFVICLGFGNGVTILLGNSLGSGEKKEAQRKAYYSLIFSVFVGLILFSILFIVSPFIVKLYTGVSIEAQEMASYMIKIYAFYTFICCINNILFFTLRSGGRTIVVFLFDSVFGWAIQIPIALIILKTTSLPIKIYFPLVYSIEILKIFLGLSLVISKKWIKNLTVNVDKLDKTIE